MKELTSYNRVAGYLNKIFDLLNAVYFESELSRPTITIQSTPKATLLHEMVHYYNYIHEVKDCSRGNTYHNRRFKDAAEARDLHVEHSDKYGWSHTSPTDALLSFVLDHDLTDILINRNELMGYRITGTGTHSGTATTITPKPSSSRKYVCPCCGMSVRATKAVNIACLDCDEQMVLAE